MKLISKMFESLSKSLLENPPQSPFFKGGSLERNIRDSCIKTVLHSKKCKELPPFEKGGQGGFFKTKLSTKILLLMTAILTCPSLVFAESNAIKLSESHLTNLGITQGPLRPVEQIPLLFAPATVVVPAANEYLVSASQAGLITRLSASVGDKVKQGELLAELNSADLLSMQRLYLKAVSELELGLLAYQRDKKLFDDGVIAQRRWQETRAAYTALASEADERRQLLSIAGMSAAEIDTLKQSRQLSAMLHLHSPITGVVVERMAVAGARIDSLAPLYRVANLNELWLEISIPQERVADIKVGDKVLVEKAGADAKNAKPISAEITLMGQTVNPDNQSIQARGRVKGSGAAAGVRPGQRVNTQIIQTYKGQAYAVPNSALSQHQGHTYVFVRTAEGFNAQAIDVIGKQGEETLIGGNLSGTETIATKGAAVLKANWIGLGSDE